MNVISLEKGKIRLLKNTVIKKTTIEEAQYLITANNLISSLEEVTIFSKKYKLQTPKFYEYKDGKLTMERCFGENLELILRNNEKHSTGVTILNTLLELLLKNEIYWQDFAPRNILISDDKVSIMDFERGIKKDCSNISDYFANTVYEEYAAFLLPNERTISLDEAISTENDIIISINDIKSKRVRYILNLLGFNNECHLSDYYLAVKMIVINETPYQTQNGIKFPLIDLENYMKRYGYEKYSKKIIGGYYDKIR